MENDQEAMSSSDDRDVEMSSDDRESDVSYRCSQPEPEPEAEVDTSDEITPSSELLDNLKRVFHSGDCTREKKIQILTLLPQSWGLAKIQEHFEVTKYMITQARTIRENNGILPAMPPKKGTEWSILPGILLARFHSAYFNALPGCGNSVHSIPYVSGDSIPDNPAVALGLPDFLHYIFPVGKYC